MTDTAPSWAVRPQYTPLLWALIPLILGIICAQYFEHVHFSTKLTIAGLSVLLFILSYWRQWPRWANSLGLAGVAFIVFWGYADMRKHAVDPRPWAPAREITAHMRVQQCYASSPDGRRARGVGRIIASQAPFDYLVGQRVAFALTGEEVAVGQFCGQCKEFLSI